MSGTTTSGHCMNTTALASESEYAAWIDVRWGTTGRKVCAECGGVVLLNTSGTLRKHRPGCNLKPEERAKFAELEAAKYNAPKQPGEWPTWTL